MNFIIDIDRKMDATLRAARAIRAASAERPLSFAKAETIAQEHRIELGIVLGHLTLLDVCAIDYAVGALQCVE